MCGWCSAGAEVVALTAEELVATNRFFCETCRKGFQREQNLRLHLRGHNIPSELQRRAEGVAPARGRCVYVCPVEDCVYHDPARALGDITGIKKHFSRKHGEKRWECERCGRMYTLDSDLRAHLKTCPGTQILRCPTCGEDFTRRKELYDVHRETCGVVAAPVADPTDFNLNVPAPFPVAGEDDLFPPPLLAPAMADPGDSPRSTSPTTSSASPSSSPPPPPPPPPSPAPSQTLIPRLGDLAQQRAESLALSDSLWIEASPFSSPDLSLYTNWSLDPTAAIGPQNNSAAEMPPPPPPPPPSSSSTSFLSELWGSFRSSEETTMTTMTTTMTTTTTMTMPTMGFGGFRPWPQPPLMSAPDALSFGCASGSSNYVGFTMNTNPPFTGGEPHNNAGSVMETQCEAPPPDEEVYRPTMVEPTATLSESTQVGTASGSGGGDPSLRVGGDGERAGEREIDGFTELMLSSFNGDGAFRSDFW
uniref:C2H2-type domain-containing protein n=1 Tax=Ananas comosus var. bracteatus TaxID=296719 RepID=A0A6V7PD48_ANACO|nr:unnamed protein product [Ananas comosus var. bracteatus]